MPPTEPAKRGVAHDGERAVEAVDVVGGAADGVAGGVARLDVELAEGEGDAGLEGGGLVEGLGLADVDADGAADFLEQAVELDDVIDVRVGEVDVLEGEVVLGERLDDGRAVGAGVEDGGEAGLRVPEKVGVDGHVAIGGVELEEAGAGRRDFRLVGALGDGDERARAELEGAREFLDLGEVDALELLDRFEFGVGEAGLGGELRIVEAEATLGFADDVRGCVLRAGCS